MRLFTDDAFAEAKIRNIKESFKPFVEKYQKVLTEAKEKKDYSHYSPAKIDEILSAIEKL